MKTTQPDAYEMLRDEFCCECGAVLAEKAGGIQRNRQPAAGAGNDAAPEQTDGHLDYLHRIGLQEEYLL